MENEYDNAWDGKESGSEIAQDDVVDEPEALGATEIEKDESPAIQPIAPPVVADAVTPEIIATWRGRVSASDRRNQELQDELKALKSKLEQQPVVAKVIPEETGDILPGFPEFNAPLKQRDSAMKAQIIEEVQSTTKSQLNEAIEPLRADAIQREQQRRMETLNSVDPLWQDKVDLPEFDAFIDSHPKYIADAMRQVKQKGSLEDAVSLLKQFNEHTERSNAVKHKRDSQADAAAPVKSRPGAAVSRASKDDYDSAFDEAPN